jgi:hypothetical protein
MQLHAQAHNSKCSSFAAGCASLNGSLVLILTNRSQEAGIYPVVATDCLLSPFSTIELERQYLHNLIR